MRGSDSSQELATGVVVHKEAAIVFYMASDGQLNALDAGSGSPVWGSGLKARPLAALEKRLLVQRDEHPKVGVLPLSIMDTDDGSELARIQAPLPGDVMALIDQTPQYKFEIETSVKKRSILIYWKASLIVNTGMKSDEGFSGITSITGGLEVDMRTGGVVTIDEQLPEQDKSHLKFPWETEHKSQLLTSAFYVDGAWVAPAREHAHIKLKRWDEKGNLLDDIQLTNTDVVVAVPSLDGKHLLLSERNGIDNWNLYRWNIYRTEDGQKIGSVQHHTGASPFVIMNSKLLFVTESYGQLVEQKWIKHPRSLNAVDLITGEKTWSKAIWDTRYKGPLPPAS